MTMLYPRNDMRKRLSTKLESLMLAGAFPEVDFHMGTEASGFKFHQYNLMEYATVSARFGKLVDLRIKTELGDSYGICTRAHSVAFMARVQAVIDSITEADVLACPERYKTSFD